MTDDVANADSVVNEPAAEAAPAERPPDGAPGEQPLSMAEAFAAAKAMVEESPAAEAVPASGTGSSDDAEPSAEPSEEGPGSRKRYDERGALQKILQLRRDGRLHELPPEAQGLVRKLEQELKQSAIREYEQQRQEEEQFRDFYLTHLAIRENDPAQYARLVSQRPELAIFMKSYEDAHPDVTLENPEGGLGPSEERLRGELARQYGQGFELMIDAIAEDGGLPADAVAALKREFKFGEHPDSMNLAVFGAKVITALAEARAKELAAKEVEKVKAAERKAYELQLQRLRGMSAPSVAVMAGLPGSGKDVKAGPLTMAEAFEAAKELLKS